MGVLVNAIEFGILYRKFDVKVGGRNDVNYIAFREMIESLLYIQLSYIIINMRSPSVFY